MYVDKLLWTLGSIDGWYKRAQRGNEKRGVANGVVTCTVSNH